MKNILLLIIIFSNNIISLDIDVIELKNKSPEKVLYIGNSYLYYNDSLHNHVRRMLEEEYSKEIDRTNYKMVTISGSRLPHHNIDYPLNYILLISRLFICYDNVLLFIHPLWPTTNQQKREYKLPKEIV